MLNEWIGLFQVRSLIFKWSEAQMSGNQVTSQQEDGKRHNSDIYKIVLRLQLQSLYVASMFSVLQIFVID